ncbi:amidohydrolase [Nakamurella silvestris]|nr:amidohydrolase [Nakamurella silvestris]
MSTYLLRGARVHTSYDPAATCVAVTDGVISWIGAEHGIPQAGRIDRVIDLDGALVTPAFVDAHVHATDAGLARIGLDLSAVRSLAECLELITAHSRRHPEGVIWGHGWEEIRWAEGRAPTREELDTAVGGRPAYLSRIDVHSGLVSSALLGAGFDRTLDGYDDQRPLTRAAHVAARELARGMLTETQRTGAQQAFLDTCAAGGMVEVHECGAPDPTGVRDLQTLLALGHPVAVRAYLGAAVTDPAEAAALLAASGAHALGGDLSVDGAIGSRTAALSHPYADAATTSGARYLTDDQIRDHLVACALAGVQPGFHAIGDDAVSAVAQGLLRAAEILAPTSAGGSGTARLASVTPRIEHAEMANAEAIAAFAATGTVASMQPLFDAAWGGVGGLYDQRLGLERAQPMNAFGAMAAAGVSLAFGSDAPVTPANPWAAVQAGVNHLTAGAGISPRSSFVAHTRGGHRAAGRTDRGVGTISVGAPADLAIWAAGELVVPQGDDKVQRWSTDPRSRTPLLPDLSPGAPLPTCLATVAGGRVIFDTGVFGDQAEQDGQG